MSHREIQYTNFILYKLTTSPICRKRIVHLKRRYHAGLGKLELIFRPHTRSRSGPPQTARRARGGFVSPRSGRPNRRLAERSAALRQHDGQHTGWQAVVEAGFAGPGTIAMAMARNLLKTGHAVTADNRTAARPRHSRSRARGLYASTMAVRSISIRNSAFDRRVTPIMVEGGNLSALPNLGMPGSRVTLRYSSTSRTKVRR